MAESGTEMGGSGVHLGLPEVHLDMLHLDASETEELGLRSRAEKSMRQVEGQEKIDETKGYLLRQFWYFCGDTSLHGLQYVPRFSGAGSIGWLHRLAWFLLVSSSVCFAWYNVWNLLDEFYQQRPKITISDTTGPLQEVYFPSVTVCNLNQIRISQTYRMGLEEKQKVSRRFIKQYILSSTGQYEAGHAKRSDPEMGKEISEEEMAEIQANLRANGIHWNETSQPLITVKGTAQDCSDLMIHTKWDDIDKYNYSSHATHTDFGFCCRIWPKLELEEPSMLGPSNGTDWFRPEYSGDKFWPEYEKRRGTKNGFENGLMLLMDVETFENAQYSRKAEGLIVALSGNMERPLVGQGYTFVEPGSSNLMSFSVFGTTTTDEAVESYPPDINGHSPGGSRACYVDNKTEGRLEFDPEYFNRERYFIYSMSNCLYSAMVGAVGRKCNCTPIYTRSVPELPLTNLENRPYCTGHQLRCMENLTRSWGSSENDLNKAQDSRHPEGAKKQCHDNCDNQDLRVATSRSGYPMKRTLPLTEDFCLIMSKMRTVCKNKHRKKAFEESYKHDSPLPNGAKLNCSIVEDVRLSHHCREETLFSPNATEELEDAVARYAKDNLLVVRVFLKDPYYQKMTRDRTMTKNAFFGSAGGWLGLCCGLSVISMLEIGYHFILFIVAICKGREMSHVKYE